MINQVKDILDGIELVEHDFRNPQPIKGMLLVLPRKLINMTIS